jgi:dihydrofolate reductase
MKISLIVAASDNDVIAKDGKIPWFVRGEQAIFKQITMGRPILMGRKTDESLKALLPGRLNVIISRNPEYKVKEGAVLVHSFEEALALPQVRRAEEVFVIGGGEIFNIALPLADKLYYTRVHTTIEGGEKFFRFDPAQWRLISSKLYKKDEVPDRPYDFEFQEWVKR